MRDHARVGEIIIECTKIEKEGEGRRERGRMGQRERGTEGAREKGEKAGQVQERGKGGRVLIE